MTEFLGDAPGSSYSSGYGCGSASGFGYGHGDGYGYGYGSGDASGEGAGAGYGYGDSCGVADGSGDGCGPHILATDGLGNVAIGCHEMSIQEWLGAEGKALAKKENYPVEVQSCLKAYLEQLIKQGPDGQRRGYL